MRFGVLGPVQVTDAGRQLELGGRRHLEVLSLLLLEPGSSVALDRLITELWGESADHRSVASLHTHLSNLRKVIGKQRIIRDANGYRLSLGTDDEVDAQVFQALSTDARALSGADPDGAAARLEEALRLWRGRPFQGLEDVPALEAEIARLDELRAADEIDRFDAILHAGGTPAIDELEELCRRRSYDERPWALLMRTLYRAGRQADALITYRHVRELFAEELGIDPSPWLARLEEQILLQDPVLNPQAVATPGNLPSYLTSFVGRARERSDLVGALAAHRLVTLTGPGGVGKTRLAVEAAGSLAAPFRDGIWLVDLARAPDEGAAGAVLAAAVGAPGGAASSLDTAAAALRGRRCLVILDNCEHVLGAAAMAARTLLQVSPGSAVLATSRVPLGVVGEHLLHLAGMPVAGVGDRSETAASLFEDRVASLSPRAEGRASEAAVHAICERLDGIPLAIELAAARCDTRSPAEIAELLTRRFAVLVDPRQDRDIHRSLEATVGWSYGLLAPDDRIAFAALGVFEGTFTLDAARAVVARDAPGSDESVARLVRASLVTVEAGADGVTGYRLLETLRAYARDRLLESGALEEAASRHDAYYLKACRELGDELLIRGRSSALRWIADASEELRAAWDRMLPDAPAKVLPIGWALANHWLVHGGIHEGATRIQDLLARTADDRSSWRMFVLAIGAWLADRRGDAGLALSWSDEALALAEADGDPLTIVVALNHAGQLRVDRGDHDTAIALLRRSLDELDRQERDGATDEGIPDGRAWATVGLAEAMRWSGRDDAEVRDLLYEARRHFAEIDDAEGLVRADRVLTTMTGIPLGERKRLADEMLDLATRSGDEQLRYEAARALATVSWDAGDRERALAANRAALRTAMASGSLTDLGSALVQAGAFAGLTGASERAARLIGAGQHICGTAPGPYQPTVLASAVGVLREQLGEQPYLRLHEIGAAMTTEEAAELVLRPAR